MSKPKEFALSWHDFAKTNGDPEANAPFHTEGASMTRQEFKDECDINTIMAQYDSYLADPLRSISEPRYVDFTSVPTSLMEAMDVLNEARDAFFRLPAVVRREFDNDPALFADYASDPANVGQMREWGLAEPEKAPDAPMRVEVVNPTRPAETPLGGSEKGSTHEST